MSTDDFLDGPNAEDQHQIAVAENQALERVRRDSADLDLILGTVEGRRFVTRILQMTGLNVLSEPDNILCHRSEGARSVGIEICAILNQHSIHAYPLLLTEAAAQIAEDKRQYAAARDARRKVTGASGMLYAASLAGLHGD